MSGRDDLLAMHKAERLRAERAEAERDLLRAEAEAEGWGFDIEWMILVTYARAAGARSSSEAQAWAREATYYDAVPFGPMCERIDAIAERELNR